MDHILNESFQPPHSCNVRLTSRANNYNPILKANAQMKIVFILVDFGLDSLSVEVKQTRATEPTVWGFTQRDTTQKSSVA
ncbi:hypothetical protein DPV78_010943 [Talaromyces pinophilus]|nr:hypothetical protein DPV78_010943 [Talaromyces pinophilus]